MYGRCDACLHEDPGQDDSGANRPVSCTPAMASDHPQSRELATTQRAGPHEDPLTASSGRPLRESDGTRSQGLISPSRRTFSTAPAGLLIPLVPTRVIGVHISSPMSSMCLRAKDHLEGTEVVVFPRYCAENKVQTGSAAAGGHRSVGTRKTMGGLASRRGTGDPERQAEWTTVLRYGHLRSAPVVVDAGYAGSGNRLRSVQPCVNSTRLGASSRAYRLSDDAHTGPLFVSVQNIATCSQFRSRTSPQFTCQK